MSMDVKVYRKLSVKEHNMQTVLLQWLKLHARHNVYWFAIPNASQRTPRQAQRMKDEGLTAGVADLCIMMPEGKVIWVELKTAKGRQSEAQKGFQSVCRTLGHPYLMPRSLDEALELLKRHEVLP